MTTPIKWHTQKDGLLRGFSVHDGQVVSLSVRDGDIRIIFSAVSGEHFRLELTQTLQFNFVGFRNGAIVGQIYVWPVPEVPRNWNISDNTWRVLFGDTVSHQNVYTRVVGDTCKFNADHLFVHIDFSYGGSIAALCKNLSIFT